MKYFAKFDAEGFPKGFYPSDIWPEPPEGSIEITEAQWIEFIENPTRRKWDGTNVVPVEEPA